MEFFDEAAGLGHAVRPGALGENIATRNIDMLNLPTGTRLAIGNEAIIELTGLRNPCHQIDKFQSGLLQHCKEETPDGVARKAGAMAVVLRGGIVQPGDDIKVRLPPAPHQPLVYRTLSRNDVSARAVAGKLPLPLDSLLRFHKEMAKQSTKRKVGRPATGTGKGVMVRLRPPLLAAVDTFVKEHDEHPSRPEAIRLILADSLTKGSYRVLKWVGRPDTA